VAGGDGVLGRFFLDRASAVRRNSMKDDLPQFLVPMTRMLSGLADFHTATTMHLLEGRGVLPPPHAARAVDSADLAARVAVAAAVRHALGPGVRVEVDEGGRRGARHGRRAHGEAVVRGRHSVVVYGRAAEVVRVVVADLVGDDGDRIGAVGLAAKGLDLRQLGMRGQARWLLRQHGGFPLFAERLLLGEGLLFAAHFGSRRAATGATRFGGALLHSQHTSVEV
jgi:hypothetical protein